VHINLNGSQLNDSIKLCHEQTSPLGMHPFRITNVAAILIILLSMAFASSVTAAIAMRLRRHTRQLGDEHFPHEAHREKVDTQQQDENETNRKTRESSSDGGYSQEHWELQQFVLGAGQEDVISELDDGGQDPFENAKAKLIKHLTSAPSDAETFGVLAHGCCFDASAEHTSEKSRKSSTFLQRQERDSLKNQDEQLEGDMEGEDHSKAQAAADGQQQSNDIMNASEWSRDKVRLSVQLRTSYHCCINCLCAYSSLQRGRLKRSN
jgi:hypothetical protein